VNLTTSELTLLILLFFITSAVGVVTGSNSLITVPVMFQFGIDPKIAVATNMFGLTFMNIGATIPFLRRGTIDKKKVSPLVFITLIASAIGAGLLIFITPQNIKLLVSIAMISVALFTLFKRDAGIAAVAEISNRARILTYVLTFALGVYGGLYSGGYDADRRLRRVFRNDVHRIGRVHQINQRLFVVNCLADFYVARFN
jgi:uncharacterized membrane protein YfcA